MEFCLSTVVLDLVESGIIVLDREKRIIYWNNFVTKCSNLKLSDHLNRSYLEVFPEIKESRLDKAVARAIDHNFPSILSHKLLKVALPLFRKSLATLPPYLIDQSMLVKPIIEDKKNNGCIIYIEDVSANAKKERDLRDQSQQLKLVLSKYENVKSELESVFDNTTNGIILFDSTGKIRKANRASESLFAMSAADLINRNIREFLPDIEAQFYCAQSQCYQYEANLENEYEQNYSDNPNSTLLVTFNTIQEREEEESYFVFINDISTIKTAEAKLRKANAELEEFAYRTSHDIRSPIVSSRALLQMSREAIHAKKEARAVKCIEQSIASLEKLERLTIDIMRLTLEEKQDESLEEISLASIVGDALQHNSQLEGYERIEKQIQLDHKVRFISKRIRIQNIIDNLISNAIKYHDPDEARPVIKVRSYSEDNSFYLEVSDNGLGIPKDQQHKVFTMFNRFHPTTSFGSGLGLYLTQKSVHSIGGRITLMEQEKGTGFRLCIPFTGA